MEVAILVIIFACVIAYIFWYNYSAKPKSDTKVFHDDGLPKVDNYPPMSQVKTPLPVDLKTDVKKVEQKAKSKPMPTVLPGVQVTEKQPVAVKKPRRSKRSKTTQVKKDQKK